MTIRDPEVLDALREQPELLAIADAVTETQRAPAPARARWLPRAGVVVAATAAALLAVLFWPGGSAKNPILDRALAAIGDGPVLHLVTRLPVGEQLVNLQTGRTIVPKYEIESWSDKNLKRFHLLYRLDGRIVGEMLYPEDRDGGVEVGSVDPAYAAFWSGYRDALESGKAKIERTGTLYRHAVYWLRFPPYQPRLPGTLVAIDQKTYRPLAFRFPIAGGRHIDSQVLLARTEPFSKAAFRRQTPAPSPFSGSSGGSTSLSPSAPLRLTKPWLTAGSTIAGLKLAEVRPLQETSAGKTTSGVELVYGSDGEISKSVTIDELKQPGDRSQWSSIPHGFVRIAGGTETQGGGAHADWTADLVRDGIYVSIETGVSRAAVLEAARALRPA